MAEEVTAEKVKNVVTIEAAGPCRKKVVVEVPEEAIKNALNEQYGDLRKEAAVPGFRKGKAPLPLLEKRFGKEIREQVKLKLLAQASEAAVKDSKLDALGEPDIDYEDVELPASGAMKFDFEVEVRPEFELPELENIPVEKPTIEITDKQVSEEIGRYQRQAGIWKVVEGGEVETDDQVIADVIIRTGGDKTEEEKLDNVEVSIRESGLVGGVPVEKLDELLGGARAGDVKRTAVDVPKSYYDERYRGKKVDLEITVKEVKRLEPAQLNEDFFKRLGVSDEEMLQARVREVLEESVERQVREAMENQVYEYLLKHTDFDLPAELVADQSMRVLQRQYNILELRGLSQSQIKEQMDELRAGSEERAKEQLKLFFVMDRIAGKLGVEVSEEEINGYIAQVAARHGRRPEKMREEMVRDGSLANFTLQVRETKCLEKLLEKAVISEVTREVGAKGKKKKDISATRSKTSTSRKKKAQKKESD